MALVQQKERKEILDLMEGYSKNPSNSNKYYSSMQALIDNRISREINSARIDELTLIKWHGSRTQESIRAGVRRKDWKETHDKTMQIIRDRLEALKRKDKER